MTKDEYVQQVRLKRAERIPKIVEIFVKLRALTDEAAILHSLDSLEAELISSLGQRNKHVHKNKKESDRLGILRIQGETLPKAIRKNKPWLSEEIDRLKKSNLTDRELALELGRSYHGVAGKRKKLYLLGELERATA